ncbi:hypothetical protein L873DRAFT_1851986 [Choiromyces venosus 120613-1]|uniref:Uncharacterized protein n=1 Tax=Choiromyces venosus 120613-1 TaxID=1336337 RepID=A0A3N4K122_9PEZI|nr:hypothetical protein L873DRAFT_1851986 [Choiromyces venosus 120613-1]
MENGDLEGTCDITFFFFFFFWFPYRNFFLFPANCGFSLLLLYFKLVFYLFFCITFFVFVFFPARSRLFMMEGWIDRWMGAIFYFGKRGGVFTVFLHCEMRLENSDRYSCGGIPPNPFLSASLRPFFPCGGCLMRFGYLGRRFCFLLSCPFIYIYIFCETPRWSRGIRSEGNIFEVSNGTFLFSLSLCSALPLFYFYFYFNHWTDMARYNITVPYCIIAIRIILFFFDFFSKEKKKKEARQHIRIIHHTTHLSFFFFFLFFFLPFL